MVFNIGDSVRVKLDTNISRGNNADLKNGDEFVVNRIGPSSKYDCDWIGPDEHGWGIIEKHLELVEPNKEKLGDLFTREEVKGIFKEEKKMDLKKIKKANLKEAKRQYDESNKNLEIGEARRQLRDAKDAIDRLDREILAKEIQKKPHQEIIDLFK